MSKKQSGENFSENFVELVNLNRVTKVVKGGRRFAFVAYIVTGDREGAAGYGHGKAKEVTEARNKATQVARKKFMKIPLYQGRTIPHDIEGKSGAAKVVLRKAPPGTGIIAGGPMRPVFTAFGIQDIVAKSLGSNNAYAMIVATFNALSKLRSLNAIAKRRGKQPTEIIASVSHN